MCLPSDIGQKGEDEKTTNYGYPKGNGSGYRKDKDRQFRPHQNECAGQGKDSSRGTNHRDKRGAQEGDSKNTAKYCQRNVENITQYPPPKVNDKELVVSNQSRKVRSKEIKRQHVSEYMPKGTVDKHTGQYRPRLR